MKFTIDRFEDNYAVVELENGKYINIPKELVKDFNEGDILNIVLNTKEMKKRHEEIEDLMDDLFQ